MSARIALSFAVVTVLAGTAQAQTSHLIGQVSYPDRVQLGKTAVLELTLEDVSDATGAGVVIATMRMPKPGQTPVIFSLEYDAARVKPAGRYALRAHIVDAGARVLESAAPVRVLTQGAGAMASVTLVQVESKPAAPSPLPAVASAKAAPPEPKTTPAPTPKPEPKATPAPKPLPAVASAKAAPPEPKTTPAPKPKPEPKATPAPRPLPAPKFTPAPKPLPAAASAKAGKPEPKSTPAPKPLPADLSAVAEAKAGASAKAGTSTPKAPAQPTAKPTSVPKSTPTPPKPSTNDASGAAAPFGTAWTIVEINGKPVSPVDKDLRKIVLAFDDNRQTYSGTSGCSDVAGRFARNGAPLMSSSDKSQLCHVDEQTERAMRSVIQDMRGYRVSSTTLELLDAKGACLAKLER